MPNLSSILSTESSNTHTLYFYREGVFYKAYERSAYLFVKYIRPFQIKKRIVKSVKQEVVSVGFPTNSLPNYFSADKIKEKENVAEIELEKEIDIHEFELWKAEIPLYQEGSSMCGQSANSKEDHEAHHNKCFENETIMKIKMFPIEGKTPLECMLFLSELKKNL